MQQDEGMESGASPPHTQMNAVSIETIEHHYMEVIKELAMEPKLEPFKKEFEKIHRLLRKSHDGEKRLMQKISELHDDLASHAVKQESALKLSEQDKEVILAFQKEIEKAWSLADSAHAHEKESREHIQDLRKQVARLDALVEKSTNNTVGQENYLRELIASKKEIENEHATAQLKAGCLKDERTLARKNLHKVQTENENVKQQLEVTMANYEALVRNHSQVREERENLELQVREYGTAAEQHMVGIASSREAISQLTAEESRLKASVASERDTIARLSKQLEEQQRRFKAEADKLAMVEAQNAELKQEIPKMKGTLKLRHTDVEQLAHALKKARKLAESQQAEMKKCLQARDELAVETNRMHQMIDEKLSALETEEKLLYDEEVRLKETMPAKTQLIVENSRIEGTRSMMEGQRVLEEGKRRNLSQQLEQILRENETMRKEIFEVENNQAKVLDHGQHAALQYHQTLEQTRKQRGRVKILQQQLADNEKRLKVQQDLLDRVSADRTRTEKRLKESELECAALKQRYSANDEEIQLLKMQIIGKEGALCRMHMVRKQFQRDITCAEQRANNLKDDVASATTNYETLRGEAKQLNHLIAECDAEKSKYKSKFAALVNERNVLATQLVRRNEELRLLYSKIRLQECTIDRGASDYNKRVKEIAAKREELEELRLRCRVSLARMLHVDKLRRRKKKIERELFNERRRSRALADELQRPVHVHRWRRLEGNAPKVLDGIYKVHSLERRILKKQDILTEKTKELAKRNAEYESIRKKLASLQGPEVAEELSLYDENLQRRKEQISGLDGELHEVEQHVDVVAEEVKQLSAELCEVKRRYYDAKHKNDLLRREQIAFRATWSGSPAVARVAQAAAEAASARMKEQQIHDQRGGTGPRTRTWQTRIQQRREQIMQERRLVQMLSTGAPASNFPLQPSPNQRLFVGGGFALTR
ncbi:hypothetical protein ERJ75_001343200 [Trypanosoma vivax]|uniref:Uncharacterized protein (Trypanosoma vivax) n=1 Tax=Trypanosoma vivax (strain Y486) TaxID=1055687 RepID=G0U5X4_TRYVY|nr:Trypanosoma vivax [Trypanosoma vivax]KAH8608273.1 hypothetical protein ERJ75_001343200 [Trypanosoma vivax]CCC51275.1 Trypanosoma vivax [Trypanosoma vivax Y486]